MEQQDYSGVAAAGGGLFMLVYFAVVVLMLAAMWKMFVKAGKPGWAAIIPLYNTIVMLEMVGRPIWWLVLAFIPFVNIAFFVILAWDLARAFGKGAGFAVGMMLLPFVFYPMLGFGSAAYQGPVAGQLPLAA